MARGTTKHECVGKRRFEGEGAKFPAHARNEEN